MEVSRFAAFIEQRSRTIIEDELNRRADWSPARSLTRIAGKVTHEYEGRFFIELIQNGHDAHPWGTIDGTLHITLDLTEGKYGCVYVANRGRPFSESNVAALCDIAASDKPPGEGIGNKGIGFRSVLQVTNWPEIYSAGDSIGSDQFGGFCFGFARPDDVLRLTDGDKSARNRILAHISPYFLPVPIAEQGSTVKEFAVQRFATVIRLPLKSALARQEALKRFTELEDSESPILLFLERISGLTLELKSDDNARRKVLRRSTRAIVGLSSQSDHQFEEVDLADQGCFFLVSAPVNHDDLLAAVRRSVKAGQIDETWSASSLR